MIRLALALAGCAGPPNAPHRPDSANAPLSLAADDRMVSVPAGRFIAGSSPEEREAAYDDYLATAGHAAEQRFEAEAERHVATLPGFKIDLMPVTQAQYAELVLAERAEPPATDDAAWSRFAWHDGRPPAGREEHPVVLVTWAEAAHYCAWRGALRGEPRRLPTADEFEKASRGDSGFTYPWGNAFEAAKLDGATTGPLDTVPVGTYLAGASPYGALDMAGNVMEWTATPCEQGAVIKGSAWNDYGGAGRGASWQGRAKTRRDALVGFRCAADAR